MLVMRMLIRFTVRVFCEHSTMCVPASFPFGFEGGMRALIVLVPGHCVSYYFGEYDERLNFSVEETQRE